MEVRSKVLHGLLVKLTYDLVLLSFFSPNTLSAQWKLQGWEYVSITEIPKLSAFSRSVTLISGLLNFKLTSVVEK
jgi:hypothetical protein